MIGNEITNYFKDLITITRNKSDRERQRLRIAKANKRAVFFDNDKEAIYLFIYSAMINSSIPLDKMVLDPATNKYVPLPNSTMGLFSSGTVERMPKIHIDVTNKVLDNLTGVIYSPGVDRYLVNSKDVLAEEVIYYEAGEVVDGVIKTDKDIKFNIGDVVCKKNEINQEETDNLLKLYDEAQADTKIPTAYKKAILHNTVHLKPSYRFGKMNIDIITPEETLVTPTDEDYLVPKEIYILRERKVKGEWENYMIYWSEAEHFIINSKGVREDKNSDGIELHNPYKILPFTKLCLKDGCDYWGEGMDDLIDNNIIYDMRESNGIYVEVMQGFGVGYSINMGRKDTMTLTPGTIVNVDNVGGTNELAAPTLNFASPNAPLAELRANNKEFYLLIGNTKGLSSATMSNEVIAQSGVAKAADNQELRLKREAHIPILRRMEIDFFKNFRIVNNIDNKQVRISPDVELRVDFKEQDIIIDPQQEREDWKFKLENNLASPVDYVIYFNPQYTEDEAKKYLQKVEEINQELNFKIIKENVNDQGRNQSQANGAGQDGAGTRRENQSGTGSNVAT